MLGRLRKVVRPLYPSLSYPILTPSSAVSLPLSPLADGRTLWTIDTQGWQTLSPVCCGTYEKMNLVQWIWDDAASLFRRGLQMAIDSSNSLMYTGNQVQISHGRYENGAWTIYAVSNTE